MEISHVYMCMNAGHLTEDESVFNYSIGDTSYLAINDGYLTHQPLFSEDLNVTQEVMDMCQEVPACIYDSVVTGNMEIGMSTLRTSATNDEIIRTLGKWKSDCQCTNSGSWDQPLVLC